MTFHLQSVRRPRNPVLHALSLLLGLALLGLLLVFGLAIAGVLLVGTGLLLAWRWWRGRHRVSAPTSAAHRNAPHVLEGEFKVVHPEHTGAN